MKQSKELLELKLKNKYHYIWEDLQKKSKLELIDLLRHRDDMLDRKRQDDLWHGGATIVVWVDGEEMYRIEFPAMEHEYYRSNIFEVARNIEAQYIDHATTKTEIVFHESFDAI